MNLQIIIILERFVTGIAPLTNCCQVIDFDMLLKYSIVSEEEFTVVTIDVLADSADSAMLALVVFFTVNVVTFL